MREALNAVSEGMKNSLRLAGWIVVTLIETISAFVNHRDLRDRHKHG